MLRPPWRLVIALVLGAGTTLVIAWLPSVSNEPPPFIREQKGVFAVGSRWAAVSLEESRDWNSTFLVEYAIVDSAVEAGVRAIEYPWWADSTRTRSLLESSLLNGRVSESMQRFDRAGGWPVRCLRGDAGSVHGQSIDDGGIIGKEVPLWARSIVDRNALYLPVRPIWIGMVVDVALFSLVAAALLSVPGSMRRWRRRRRGACEQCGYGPLTGATCPECGVHR